MRPRDDRAMAGSGNAEARSILSASHRFSTSFVLHEAAGYEETGSRKSHNFAVICGDMPPPPAPTLRRAARHSSLPVNDVPELPPVATLTGASPRHHVVAGAEQLKVIQVIDHRDALSL